MSEHFNIDSILAELRIRARNNSATGSADTDNEAAHHEPLPDAATLYYGSDICCDPFTSHRPVLGKFIIRLKNFAKELLVQILERQVRYNFANAKLVMALRQNAISLAQSQNEIHAWRVELDRAQTDLAAKVEHLTRDQSTIRRALDTIENSLNQSLKALEAGFNESLRASEAGINESLKALEAGFNESLTASEIRTTSSIDELKSELRSNSSADEIRFREKADAAVLSELQGEHSRIEQELHEHKRMAVDQQRRLSILLTEVRRQLTSSNSTEPLERIAPEGAHLLDSMYFTLEERFRGTREDIKDRLTVYLPCINALRTNSTATDSPSVLDIGCGRGEFLELLRDKGIRATGVDLNRVFVDECRKMGLTVVDAEALAFLRQQRDGTFDAISAIHVVEHLRFNDLIALLDEMLRVLKPQGLAILETPNPNNVLVGSGQFYLDPTHKKPLPPALLEFLVEARGFCNVQVQELHPFPTFYKLPESVVAERFNELFYGPQDYAVLAYRA